MYFHHWILFRLPSFRTSAKLDKLKIKKRFGLCVPGYMITS